jgi:hypothetical protein
MKYSRYLNGVLTIIAVCLSIICLNLLGLIPSANAREVPQQKFTNVPVNSDGTITVKFAPNAIMDVNIEEVGGYSTFGNLNVDIKKVYGTRSDYPLKAEMIAKGP